MCTWKIVPDGLEELVLGGVHEVHKEVARVQQEVVLDRGLGWCGVCWVRGATEGRTGTEME